VSGQSGGEGILVGALTRYRYLERDQSFLASCPLFADALPHIAHPQIRNRGTIGGNQRGVDQARRGNHGSLTPQTDAEPYPALRCGNRHPGRIKWQV
jgi:CO/xanthine dehydrogenase FAD-binding subunit